MKKITREVIVELTRGDRTIQENGEIEKEIRDWFDNFNKPFGDCNGCDPYFGNYPDKVKVIYRVEKED